MDHETCAEDLNGDGGECRVLVGTCEADDDADNERKEARADIVRIVDVAGVLDREVVHGLEVRREIGIPALP